MTVKEAKAMIEELKAMGNTEEAILEGFFLMFQEGKINSGELGDLVQLLGYELSEEFYKDYK